MCVVHHASIGFSEAVPLSELVAIAEDPEVDTNLFEESMRFDADKLEVDTILLDCICIIDADSTDLFVVCFEAPSKVTSEFLGENPWTNCKRTTIRQTIFLVIVSFFFNVLAEISHLEFICCILCCLDIEAFGRFEFGISSVVNSVLLLQTRVTFSILMDSIFC